MWHSLKKLKAALDTFTRNIYGTRKSTNFCSWWFVCKKIWYYEINSGSEKRLLHHLRQKEKDIEPSNFDKMNIAAAIRFFSIKTSSALKTTVELNILHKIAFTSADFITIVNQWYTLVTSKVRKMSTKTIKHWLLLGNIDSLFRHIVTWNLYVCIYNLLSFV